MSSMAKTSYAQAYHACFSGFLGDFALLRTLLPDLPPGNLVEFGSGSGRILKEKWNRHWVLIEQDPEMLQIFKDSLAGYEHQDYEIVSKSVLENGLADSSAALVFCSTNSLAEMRPMEDVFAEAYRILKPGGMLLALNENPLLWEKLKTPKWLPVTIEDRNLEFFVETLPGASSPFVTKFLLRDAETKALEREFIVPQDLRKGAELQNLSMLAGFDTAQLFGGFSGEDFSEAKSLSLILLATK